MLIDLCIGFTILFLILIIFCAGVVVGHRRAIKRAMKIIAETFQAKQIMDDEATRNQQPLIVVPFANRLFGGREDKKPGDMN